MSCQLDPAIWSRDTGQRITWFDRCQLIITWMSNIKEVHSKPRLHVSVNLLFEVWQPSCATPPSSSLSSSSSCVRAHEHQLMGFLLFPIYGLLMGLRLAALRAAGAPLLRSTRLRPLYLLNIPLLSWCKGLFQKCWPNVRVGECEPNDLSMN